MWIPSTFSRLPFRSLTFWSLTWCNTSRKITRHQSDTDFLFFLLAKTHPPLRQSASTASAFALCAHRPPTLLQNKRDPYNVRWDVSRRLMHGFVMSRDVSCIHFWIWEVSRRLMHTFWIWDVSRRLMHTFFWLQMFSIFFTMNLAVKCFRFFYNEFGCKNFRQFFFWTVHFPPPPQK